MAALGIFASLKLYAAKWKVKGEQKLTQEEINATTKAEVVPSQYGKSVCFMLVTGEQCYIPLDETSTIGVGETLDLNKIVIKTLEREGSDDIMRVYVE